MLGGEPLKHECTVDDLVAQVNSCLSGIWRAQR